jgi:hypothetical protein
VVLDRGGSRDTDRYQGERVAQSLACIGTLVARKKSMAELKATVAVTIAAEGQQREADWVGLVDGRPRTELERDRHPVLCVEHEPLHRYSLVRWAVGLGAAVGAIRAPVPCEFELQSTSCTKLSVKKHVDHQGKPTNHARARGSVHLTRRLAERARIVWWATSTASGRGLNVRWGFLVHVKAVIPEFGFSPRTVGLRV